jgi:hypothetical protein
MKYVDVLSRETSTHPETGGKPRDFAWVLSPVQVLHREKRFKPGLNPAKGPLRGHHAHPAAVHPLSVEN